MLRLCTHCNTENHGDANFCKHCGTALTPNHSSPTSTPPQPPNHRSGKFFRGWLIFLLATAVVLACGSGWYWYQHQVNDQTKQAGASNSEESATSSNKPGNARKPAQGPSNSSKPRASGKGNVETLCADRSNFITRDFCISRLCQQPEHKQEETCAKIQQMEETRRNKSDA